MKRGFYSFVMKNLPVKFDLLILCIKIKINSAISITILEKTRPHASHRTPHASNY